MRRVNKVHNQSSPLPKAFRVWFTDGSALLIDAETELAARALAQRLAKDNGYNSNIKRVECLSA
jgi:hypothetical protein